MIWKELGIEQTDDIKQIKRAYATKLKQTRPDEKPKEFQTLHSAYKSALQLAHSQALQYSKQETAYIEESSDKRGDHDSTDEITLTNSQQHEQDNGAEQLDSIQQEQDSESHAEQQAADEHHQQVTLEMRTLISQVASLLAKPNLLTETKNWQFLSQSPMLLDPNFNWHLGKEVLGLIADYNTSVDDKPSRYRKYTPPVNAEVLSYLNSVFNWLDDEYYLRQEIGNDICDQLLPSIDRYSEDDTLKSLNALRGSKNIKQVIEQQQQALNFYYFGNDLKRLIALSIDMLIVLFPVVYVMEKAALLWSLEGKLSQYEDIRAISLLFIFFVFTWLFDCSKYQATPGKMLLGLKVTNKKFLRLGYWHGLLRTVVFLTSGFGLYLTLLVNAWLNSKYLHDRITRSLVIDMRRSKKEHKQKTI